MLDACVFDQSSHGSVTEPGGKYISGSGSYLDEQLEIYFGLFVGEELVCFDLSEAF